MIDFSEVVLKEMAIHYVGNKSKDEGVYLSRKSFTFFDETVLENFVEYFTKPFQSTPEFYNFFHPADINLNEVSSFSTAYFTGKIDFAAMAEKMARMLYDKSEHPNINGGELFIVSFTGINLNGVPADALGIYKSEVKDTFIKLNKVESSYNYQMDAGINIKAVDKGCVIFNTGQDDKFTVCVVDNINKSKEAKFWMDDFLRLINCQDSFHFTKDYLDVAKKFVTEKMTEVYDLSKADKIDYLNKSIGYFKKNDHFAEQDFLQDVFQHSDVIENFNQFKQQYAFENEMKLDHDFDISNQAVKKQARIFKSILKLDKNFHIYIHGNKQLIEKGTEVDGRKFYKIYYDNEA